MKSKFVRFNTYLLVARATLALVSACHSLGGHKKKKILTTLELHLEVTPDGSGDNQSVPIFREKPIYINVAKESFLDGEDLEEAKVMDELGGYVIRLRFNWRGTQVLSGITTANRNRRIAVLVGFEKERWLAAPMIEKPIMDGVLRFTPDCTREEADKIVEGLNNVVTEMKKEDKL
jgi:preprotein translocase subunit SecD